MKKLLLSLLVPKSPILICLLFSLLLQPFLPVEAPGLKGRHLNLSQLLFPASQITPGPFPSLSLSLSLRKKKKKLSPRAHRLLLRQLVVC